MPVKGKLYKGILDLIKNNNIGIKFIIIGVWNSIFGYGVYLILLIWFEDLFEPQHYVYLSAMVLGQIIGTVNAFIFHKYITFKSKTTSTEIIAEFIRFCLTYVTTFIISLILLPLFVEILKISPQISGGLILIINALFSYLGHSRFSFKTHVL